MYTLLVESIRRCRIELPDKSLFLLLQLRPSPSVGQRSSPVPVASIASSVASGATDSRTARMAAMKRTAVSASFHCTCVHSPSIPILTSPILTASTHHPSVFKWFSNFIGALSSRSRVHSWEYPVPCLKPGSAGSHWSHMLGSGAKLCQNWNLESLTGWACTLPL